jgi:hypothetical protein
MKNTPSYLSLSCQSCQNLFVWSVEEQELFEKRNLPKPVHCPICRGMNSAREKDGARVKYEGHK